MITGVEVVPDLLAIGIFGLEPIGCFLVVWFHQESSDILMSKQIMGANKDTFIIFRVDKEDYG